MKSKLQTDSVIEAINRIGGNEMLCKTEILDRKKGTILRGKSIIRQSSPSLPPYKFAQFEILLNNSEAEGVTEQFSQKESIIIELFEDFILMQDFKLNEMEDIVKEVKCVIIDSFTSNTFTEDNEIIDVVDFIEDVLKRKGFKYSLYVNTGSGSNNSNCIPKVPFYYSLICSYKMKELVPYTYIAEKAKTRNDFYIETNKAYNGRFLDEEPDMIYLNIWNVKEKKENRKSKRILPGDREFADVLKNLEDSSFEKIEKQYYEPNDKCFSF